MYKVNELGYYKSLRSSSPCRTPLHCAASCNNIQMVIFLVEHGACIFATTISDQETAAEKCEEDEEGFDGCSDYLYSKWRLEDLIQCKEFFKCASSGVLNLIMIPEHKMKRELTCTDLIFLRLEEFLSGQMKGHIVTKSNRLWFLHLLTFIN